MKLTIEYKILDLSKRILCISDIHGNLTVFQKLLEKVNYNKNDILILLGDMIEKGNQSLKCVQYIMQLQLENEVYVICGNCETLWEEIVDDSKTNELYRYMNFRKDSIIWEMVREISVDIFTIEDLMYALPLIRERYHNELQWLKSLPIILDIPQMTFVHAGLQTSVLEENKAEECLKTDAFLDQPSSFDKYVIVGHWPVVNYCKVRPSCNPIIDEVHKKIAIDGGNKVKNEGQLNVFIINNLMQFSYDCYEETLKIKVSKDQEESSHSINISWYDNIIEIINEEGNMYFVKHKSSGHSFWISKDEVFIKSDGSHCYDYTNYNLSLKQGEEVLVYKENKDAYFVKKNGIMGWMKK
ncbi:MAG: metallophosphoesterase [Haloplasmataceae bacterium]|jgi:hypothetical protein|nr:metallophosphoesterase [Haloplasmataceae bacterium]